MYMPFGRGPTTPVRGLTNHGYELNTNWDDPPRKPHDQLKGAVRVLGKT